MDKVFVQWLHRSGRSPALVFSQGHKHPTHGRRLGPSAIKNVLPRVQDLLGPGQGPVHFAVAHGRLGGSIQVIPIGRIEVNALATAPTVVVRCDPKLHPAGILGALLQGGARGHIAISGIRPVVLQQIESRGGEELVQLLVVRESPIAGQGRTVSMGRAFALGRHYIVSVSNTPARKQRVASNFNPLRVGIVRITLHLGEVLGAVVLHVEPASKGKDHHFKTHLRTLIDRELDTFPIRIAHVHH